MSTTLPSNSSMIEGRVRRSWGSLEWQTAQSHPRVGTPMEVPLPNTVKVAFMVALSSAAGTGGGAWLWRAGEGVGHLDVGHAEFVKTVLQEIFLRRREIPFGFFRDQTERVDSLARSDDVDLRLRALLAHQTELHHGGHIERGEEAFKGDFEIFGGMAAQFDLGVEILGGAAIGGGLG